MSGKSIKQIPVNLTAIFNTQTENFEKVEIMPKNPTDVCVVSRIKTTETLQDEYKFLREIIEMFISDEIFDRLHVKIVNGDVEFIKKMITVGADSYFKINEGESFLSTALVSEKYEIAELLIENGVDMNKTNKAGEQIVFDLIRKNHINQLKFLLKHGLNLNICSECQRKIVPLGLAAYIGKMDIVKLFVENGADINKCNSYNQSPLYLAAAANYIEIAKYLIANNADIHIQSVQENSFVTVTMSILDVAAEHHHAEMTKLLLENGAKSSDPAPFKFTITHFIEKIKKEIAEEKQKSTSQVINIELNTEQPAKQTTEQTAEQIIEPTSVKTESLITFSVETKPSDNKIYRIVKTTLLINGKNYPYEGNIDDIPNFIDVVSKLPK